MVPSMANIITSVCSSILAKKLIFVFLAEKLPYPFDRSFCSLFIPLLRDTLWKDYFWFALFFCLGRNNFKYFKTIGVLSQCGLSACLFSPVTSSKFPITLFFFIFGCLINFDSHILSGPVPYVYNVTQSNVCNLSSSFPPRTIPLTFSMNTMYNLLLNLCCNSNIVLLLFRHFS